jgi:uncharacterized membrane protein HdeD (DUF308 family)
MSATPARARGSALEQVSQRWKTAVAFGTVSVVVGFVAIVVPAAASVGVAIFIGWVLVFGAIVQLFDAFTVQDRNRMILRLVLAGVMAAAGIYLLVAPLHGTVTLTVVLCIWFFLTGLLRLIAAWRDRGTPAAGSFAISGTLSLVLGLLVALELPSSSSWAIGLLVGVDFICFGWVLIMIGLAARRPRSAPA